MEHKGKNLPSCRYQENLLTPASDGRIVGLFFSLNKKIRTRSISSLDFMLLNLIWWFCLQWNSKETVQVDMSALSFLFRKPRCLYQHSCTIWFLCVYLYRCNICGAFSFTMGKINYFPKHYDYPLCNLKEFQ